MRFFLLASPEKCLISKKEFRDNMQNSSALPLPSPPVGIDLVSEAEALYDAGLFLQVQPLLPDLFAHETLRGRLIAASTKSHLGARRSGDAFITRCWRNHRNDPHAMIAYLRMLAYRRGPYLAWEFFHEHQLPGNADPALVAEWLSTQGYTHGLLRDFERAHQCFEKAVRLAPDDPWIRIERSYVYEAQDMYASAVDMAREVLKQHPNFRPGIQALGHYLTLVGRDNEALDILTRGVEKSESATLAWDLLNLQFEHGMYEEARHTLLRANRYAPLADKHVKAWAAARSADIALRLGEIELARSDAITAGGPFYEQIAQRLAMPGAERRRICLPVGFVRQNHMTCAPATLSALSSYWGKPADHLDIAEKICYDGTPYHSERKWAEDQGYLVREFTVNWDVARALLDAGVPFTLVTVQTGNSHLQAAIGYDELRGTLLIRDPFERTYGEFDAAKFFESHMSSGPRGMVLVPHEEGHRIAGVVLPDTDLWDGYYQVMTALQQHDRTAAAQIADELASRNPDHQLSLNARRALAMYDGNEPALLAITEKLLEKYPNDVNLQLSKAASLSLLGTREQRLAWLQQLATATVPDTYVLIRYVSLLQDDQRESKAAEKLLRRAMKIMPSNASGWTELANLYWNKDEKATGMECYRFASCLQDTNEDYASTYFRAGVLLRRTDEVLAFLRSRHSRLGGKSSQPLITLFLQMESLERTEEAFNLLEVGLAENPGDASLVLFAADVYLRYNKIKQARALLGSSTVPAKQAGWLRAQSNLAREMGEPERALELAREAVALEPLNLGLYRQIASLLAQLHGQSKAIGYLREVCERFDHHCGLHELLYSFMHNEPLPDSEKVLRHLIGINAGNLWAQRELASNLVRQQRFDEARSIIDLACAMAPTQSLNYSMLAYVCIKEGDIQAARLQLRKALTLSIDNDYALSTLIDLCQTLEERKEALDFIRAELMRQVTLGEALLAFQSAAQTTLTPDVLTDVLRDALEQRPDLWQAWLTLGIQLRDAGKLDEAREQLEKAVHKFPLLPRAHLELARVQLLSGNRELALENLRTALQLNPHWGLAVRTYVNATLDAGGSPEPALRALDVALARSPDNADLLALRSHVLSRMSRPDEAIAEIQRAIMADPSLAWPWDVLRRLAGEQSNHGKVEQVARELTVSYPGNHWCWIRLANYCADPDEGLEACEKALFLDPRSEAAYETKLEILLRNSRFDELQAALENVPWTGFVPTGVRVYEARLSRAKGWNSAALKKMRDLLDGDPNHYGLWAEYADWCDQDGEQKEYLEAAENMLRLAPNYYVAHGYLADALRKNGQEQRAMPHFERAFALDPSYVFAGLYLADKALDAQDAERASEVLSTLSQHSDSAVVLARKVRLAVLKQDSVEALAIAHLIFSRTGEDTSWASKSAIEHITNAGWAERLLEQIAATAAQGHCSHEAVSHLIAQQGKGFIPSLYRDMKRLFRSDPHHTLKRGLLSWLADTRDHRVLDRFVKDYRQILQADLDCWCEAGYAYLSQDRYADVVRWMEGWQSRQSVPSWALDNLAVALRSLALHEKARAVSLRSLELSPRNNDAKVWLALDAARLSQHQELSRLLAEIEVNKLRLYYQKLVEIMRHYLDAQQSGEFSKALANLRRIRAENVGGLPAQALIKELSSKLIGRCQWWIRPVHWLRHQFA